MAQGGGLGWQATHLLIKVVRLCIELAAMVGEWWGGGVVSSRAQGEFNARANKPRFGRCRSTVRSGRGAEADGSWCFYERRQRDA